MWRNSLAAPQGADREALGNLEDSAGEVGARLQQLDADQAGLREQLGATEAGLAAAQQELGAKKREHEAAAAANRRALCAASPAAHLRFYARETSHACIGVLMCGTASPGLLHAAAQL